jgi:hypothetical protein
MSVCQWMLARMAASEQRVYEKGLPLTVVGDIFAVDDEAAGAQAVGDGVQAGDSLALRRGRPALHTPGAIFDYRHARIKATAKGAQGPGAATRRGQANHAIRTTAASAARLRDAGSHRRPVSPLRPRHHRQPLALTPLVFDNLTARHTPQLSLPQPQTSPGERSEPKKTQPPATSHQPPAT